MHEREDARMMTLYSGPVSWFARKVEIALHELGLPFWQVLVPFSQTRGYFNRPADLLRINPKHQVPVLIDGDVELYDSTVIIEYLLDRYAADQSGAGKARLLPSDPILRARCRLWDVYADEVMLGPIRKLMHRTEPYDKNSASWQDLEATALTAMPTIGSHLDKLEQSLQSTDYLCGSFTVADISCFMPVFWSHRLAGPGFGSRHALRAWYERLGARPAFRRVTEEIKSQDALLSAAVAGAYA